MDGRLTDRKWKTEKQKCLLWGFVPVFGFFAFLLMADNSGQEKYRKKGKAFAVISISAFLMTVSGDILIYFVTVCMGTRSAAYARSLVIVAGITLFASYIILLIRIVADRKDYLEECAYMDKASPLEEKEDTAGKELCDLNTCSREELLKLPGIDAAMSKRIIDDREGYGGYASVDEFIDRYGIKPHFAAKILNMAFVSDDNVRPVQYRVISAGRPLRAIDI